MGKKIILPGASNKIIEEIYQERYRFILKYASGFLSGQDDILDFLLETFARFCRGFAMHPDLPKGVLTAYLYRIMQNLRSDILTERAKNRKIISWEDIETIPDPKPMEDATFSVLDLKNAVQQIDELPSKYSLFLKMKYFGDFSDDEIAGALGVKKNSLRMIHSRARAQLKELCEKEGTQL